MVSLGNVQLELQLTFGLFEAAETWRPLNGSAVSLVTRNLIVVCPPGSMTSGLAETLSSPSAAKAGDARPSSPDAARTATTPARIAHARRCVLTPTPLPK